MRLLSPLALLRDAFGALRPAWLPITAMLLGFHLLMLLVASPLISWLFREAMRANGMLALDFGSMTLTGGIGLTLGLILVILLIAFWIASLQFTVLMLMLHRAYEGKPITLRGIAAEAGGIARKLLRPSSLPLFFYLFFILPLSGFGFASALSQGIAVPTFISGELMKSPVSAALWTGFLLLLALLNLRFALSLPIFVLTKTSGGNSMRQSWRLTAGWASLRLALAVAALLLAAAAVTLLIVVAAILPTALSDELAPAASPFVAAFSLGLAQVASMVLTSFVIALLGAVLIALVRQREDRLPSTMRLLGAADTAVPDAAVAAPDGAEVDTREPPAAIAPRRQRAILALVTSAAVLATALGAFHIGTMQQLSQHPDTLVLGHRGFSDGGAENTIAGLEAAAAAGADLVEIDVMQTADERFVVMHDASLSRLTGQDLKVMDLTLDELRRLTVRDQFGHEGKIPSVEEYLARANELDMPLLIEIKLSGAEQKPHHVDLLVDELDRIDGMSGNIFHTLDLPSATRLKEIRPEATVGYILAFAGLGVPETTADFIVVEEWSATQEMQDSATRAGLGFFSWTVNDEAGIRELLRRDVDGIITDHPDAALAARSDMQEETGLAGTLIDALTRFVVVF